MSASVLVTYASKRGSTREVAESVASTLLRAGLNAELRPVEAVTSLEGVDAVVLGGALYMGRLHREARRFLKRHRTELAALPLAVFAMGPGKDEPKELGQSRKQLDRALAAVPELKPVEIAVFGGVFNPDTFPFPINHAPAIDARDWGVIESWSGRVAHAFGTQPAPSQAARSA
ncbi:MAG: flavodoxin domain-containing protein [Gaiellales bacterium]